MDSLTITGIVIGCIAGALSLISIVYRCCKFCKLQSQEESGSNGVQTEGEGEDRPSTWERFRRGFPLSR